MAGRFVCISGIQIIVAAARDTPWSCSCAGLGACITGSHGTVTVRKTVRERLEPQGIAQIDLGIPLVFLRRSPLCLSRTLAWGESFMLSTHLLHSIVAFKEYRMWVLSWHSLSSLLQLAGISEKRAYTLLWSPNFCNWHPEDTSRLYDSGGQQRWCLWSHRTVLLAYLQKLMPEGLASRQPECRCPDPPFQDAE